ncbi:uncharacterized protein BP5553_10025 [Venustampulla echinocandica]|uniref:Uncharacterized protein n=1 Tax=Venustampulla echinocandica TaxID=2656787 RepID=A0A370TA70_9HELO|nr:uncharacterized protein BP5553_10025 [Venustampulla echinocandica]RDL30680.1 hypothetical protein BP5553_10025 [Venustampulla echinocandica]
MAEVRNNHGRQSTFDDDNVRDRDPTVAVGDSRPVPQLEDAPPGRSSQEGIPGTPFAPTYRSIFTVTGPGKKLLPSLAHVNCSYLSTRGFPPTLLQLKQHVHSLTVLIKAITVSTAPGVVDNANKGLPNLPSFTDGETYDFLNDLCKPYQGPKNKALKPHHNLPLTSLLNFVEEKHIHSDDRRSTEVRVRDICPLHRSEEIPDNGHALPYATHQALIAHANEVLELLDHEYSAKGGVLGILPGEDEKDDREKAESTLLGQMILYLQRLVQRLHDLERLYANAMDVIAGEAVVPHQALSRLGVDGRKGREVVYPQDRFVLANAGEDLWQFLNGEFEKKEVEDALAMSSSKSQGVTGEALWKRQGDLETSKGMVALDITTRYYRLRGDKLKTVFVIPAHQNHPGTKVTRDMEKVPTVVSVVKPTWPERASTLEKKHRSDIEDLKRLRQENTLLKAEAEWGQDEKKILLFQHETLSGKVQHYKNKAEKMRSILKEPRNTTKRGLVELANNNLALQAELEGLLKEVRKDRESVEKEKMAAKEAKREQGRLRLGLMEQHLELAANERKAEEAQNMADKLKEAWKGRIIEVEVLKQYLTEKHIETGEKQVSEANMKKGRESAAQIIASILSDRPSGEVIVPGEETGQRGPSMSGAL